MLKIAKKSHASKTGKNGTLFPLHSFNLIAEGIDLKK